MKTRLQSVIFEVTQLCNHKCTYCYNSWKRDGNKKCERGSYSKAVKTLRKLINIADFERVTFTGGEPFLSERFLELILYAKMKKKKVTLISNGTVSTKEDLDSALDIGVNLFEYTLNSYKRDTHEKMNGLKGSFDKTVDAIKYVKNRGGNVVVVIVVTKDNFMDVEKTLQFIHGLGIRRIMFNRYNIGGSSMDKLDQIVTNKSELHEAFEMADKVAKEKKMLIYSSVCTPLCLLNPKDFPSIKFSFCNADPEKRSFTFDFAGNVRFCNHSPYVMGNIFETDLDKIIHSEYMEQWKQVPAFCGNCHYFDLCQGGCRAACEQMGMSLKEVDPIIKFAS